MTQYFGVSMPSYLCRMKPPQLTDEEPAKLCTATIVQPNVSSLPPSSSPIKYNMLLLVKKPVMQLSSPAQKNVADFLSSYALAKEEKQRVKRERKRERKRLHASIPPSSKSSALSEEEKQRVNRERNRLHSQHMRNRKREQLESLKERIDALQGEHELLRQAYDFHATAVCLLHLGNVVDLPCVHKLEQVGVDATEDRDEVGQLCEGATHDSDVDVEQDDALSHNKSCAALDKEGDACSFPQLNANGKRRYAARASSKCSKEERERLRRERKRERNRLHHLRTKMVFERHQQAVHDLRERNDRLRSRLRMLVSSIYGSEAILDDPDATS